MNSGIGVQTGILKMHVVEMLGKRGRPVESAKEKGHCSSDWKQQVGSGVLPAEASQQDYVSLAVKITWNPLNLAISPSVLNPGP